jgi:hypothetical protein
MDILYVCSQTLAQLITINIYSKGIFRNLQINKSVEKCCHIFLLTITMSSTTIITTALMLTHLSIR